MNIQQAREHIRNAITAYRTRDELGRPVIPVQRQRPIFLIGAPGIGKTAIMEQISQELGLPLVSYSMTHHTRQSALGLPFITDKDFGGQIHRTTEYTMSEIIAAVHEKMEQTGVKEGILFLDELNCVSETLSPAMLQFLQYKTFGQHRVPDGWIIVTAGNPPEYNDSVHEFDMVTMDRVKCIQVEASFETWRGWAMDAGVHPAVISYLDVRRDDLCTT
jgi:MoxR-like ATPase